MLVGTDNAEREQIAKTVRDAYAARTMYAHGGEPQAVQLPDLRRIVRGVLLARLILRDDDTAACPTLSVLADRALLNHSVLDDEIRAPISRFWEEVDKAEV